MKLKVFTTNTCAYCHMVKKYLTNKGKEFTEVNLDENPQEQQEALRLSGALTVPVTVAYENDEPRKVVVGFNIPQLATL